jgi:hypothetical protein
VFKANLDNHEFISFAVSLFFGTSLALSAENRCIIMLHGLGFSANSLWISEQFFTADDYEVHLLAYSSSKKRS